MHSAFPFLSPAEQPLAIRAFDGAPRKKRRPTLKIGRRFLHGTATDYQFRILFIS